MHGLSKEFIVNTNFEIRDSLRNINSARDSLNQLKTDNSCKKHTNILLRKDRQIDELENQCSSVESRIFEIIHDGNSNATESNEQGNSNKFEHALKQYKKTKESKNELIKLNQKSDMQLSYYRSPKNSSRPKSHNSACNDLLGYLNEQRDGKLLKPEIRI